MGVLALVVGVLALVVGVLALAVMVRMVRMVRCTVLVGVFVEPGVRVNALRQTDGINVDIHAGGASDVCEDLLPGALSNSVGLQQRNRGVGTEVERDVEAPPRPAG